MLRCHYIAGGKKAAVGVVRHPRQPSENKNLPVTYFAKIILINLVSWYYTEFFLLSSVLNTIFPFTESMDKVCEMGQTLLLVTVIKSQRNSTHSCKEKKEVLCIDCKTKRKILNILALGLRSGVLCNLSLSQNSDVLTFNSPADY